MLEIRLHERISEIAQADWDALALADESPFVEWTWLDCLEQAGCVGGRSGWQPCHLGVYEVPDGALQPGKGGTLIAAAPLYRKTNSEGEFVFDWSWADFAQRAGIPYYPKLVCAVPFTPARGSRLLMHPSLEPEARAELHRSVAATLIKQAKALRVHGIHVLFPAAIRNDF